MFFLAMHVCGQLEILKVDFHELARAENSVERFHKKIIGLIKRHYELITFAEHLEDTFYFMILVRLLVGSVMICILGFQFILSLENGDLLGAGKYTLFILPR